MIYVEENDFNRQIELIGFLAENRPYSICAWLYPESKVSEVAGFKVCSENSHIEQITTYSDGVTTKHTELVPATKTNIKAYLDAKNELKANCDSLALYPEQSSNWFAAAIGHEGMCLVKESGLLSGLLSAGFNASSEAPSWW